MLFSLKKKVFRRVYISVQKFYTLKIEDRQYFQDVFKEYDTIVLLSREAGSGIDDLDAIYFIGVNVLFIYFIRYQTESD